MSERAVRRQLRLGFIWGLIRAERRNQNTPGWDDMLEVWNHIEVLMDSTC